MNDPGPTLGQDDGRPSMALIVHMLEQAGEKNERQLERTEARLMAAIIGSEERLKVAMGDLGVRVLALEEWRAEADQARAIRDAERSARISVIQSPIDWAASHWQVILAIAAVLTLLLAFLADVRVEPQ